jgi:hypothetical protein
MLRSLCEHFFFVQHKRHKLCYHKLCCYNFCYYKLCYVENILRVNFVTCKCWNFLRFFLLRTPSSKLCCRPLVVERLAFPLESTHTSGNVTANVWGEGGFWGVELKVFGVAKQSGHFRGCITQCQTSFGRIFTVSYYSGRSVTVSKWKVD